MAKQAFEPTGLVPRSIVRTVDRFRQQLLPGTRDAAVQEFRVSRYQVLTSLKCLLSLLVVPFLVNHLAKTFIFAPTVEYFWNTWQGEIFINSYQEDRALHELYNFSERAYFDALLGNAPPPYLIQSGGQASQGCTGAPRQEGPCGQLLATGSLQGPEAIDDTPPTSSKRVVPPLQPRGANITTRDAPGTGGLSWMRRPSVEPAQGVGLPPLLGEALGEPDEPMRLLDVQQHLQNGTQGKALELATLYNRESMSAVVNVLGDMVTFVTVFSLSVGMRPQIIILRSFLTESIYSLSDTTKSFLLILVTDLLVGFHSPRGWEIGIEMLLRHLGLPEDQDFIFLFVAAFPVFLDTIFKYWIFRYLNKISPSTVATYHNMIE
jgi:hypothetical protein